MEARAVQSRWRTQTTKFDAATVEACWRPMEGDVAGDFYDVIDLKDGRLAVAVGDAPGYGRRAAALAEELRSALRQAFQHSDDPVRVLCELDRTMADADEELATAICAVIDPGRRLVSVSNAGHVPVVASNAGSLSYLPVEHDPPLGVDARRRSTVHAVTAETTLFFYTDGLVERRDIPIEHGLSALRSAGQGLTAATAWASELARRAVERLGVPADDATVVSVRLAGAPRIQVRPGGVDAGAGVQRVALRVYVDPRDLRSRQTIAVVEELARRLRGVLDVESEVVDGVAEAGADDIASDGVLATPMVVRLAPEPVVRVIGGLRSAVDLARSLQLPIAEEDQ